MKRLSINVKWIYFTLTNLWKNDIEIDRYYNADEFRLRLRKVFFWLETNQFRASHFKFHLVFT